MAEVAAKRQLKPPDVGSWFGSYSPQFSGSLFSTNPVVLMRRLVDDMDRFFAQPPMTAGNAATWSPTIEVKEKDGKIFVTAELPGLTKDDVKVHIEGETLVIEGEKKQDKEEKREGFFHSERHYGAFYRSLLLPPGVQSEQTTAQFNNGLLEIAIPVAGRKPERKDVPVLEAARK